MSNSVIIRCEKCGKVLKGKAEKTQIFGLCPSCGEKVVIPDAVSLEKRKYQRAVVGENRFILPIPENLSQSKDPPVYRVMYTEVSPVQFALKRSIHVPLLDLSEGGMGLLVRADETSQKLVPGDIFIAEVDFPILVQPIFVEVEIRWIRPLKEDKLLQIGGRFSDTDESFKGVLEFLMKYITSRVDKLDFERWGAFG